MGGAGQQVFIDATDPSGRIVLSLLVIFLIIILAKAAGGPNE